MFILGFFFLIAYFLLKDNCFTEFCCFLPNLNMNQPQMYIYPLPVKAPSPFHPSSLIQSLCFEFPEPYRKFPLAIYFIYGNVSFHVTLSLHLTLSSPLPMSISLFSMSASPFLLCRQIRQCHPSRVHVNALIYDICLSLSDSLHSV